MEFLKAFAKNNIKASGICVTDIDLINTLQGHNIILVASKLTPFQAQALPSNVIGVILPRQMASSHCTIVLKHKKISVFLSDSAFYKMHSGDYAALNPYTSTIYLIKKEKLGALTS